MALACTEPTDPRIRRTRQLLLQAMGNLLESKEFDKISIQEIADAATVNRVTFYDHYPDKFALLDAMVGARFHDLLTQRGIAFDGSCPSALFGIVLATSDFLTAAPGSGCAPQRQMEPHLESAILRVVRGMLLEGFRHHPVPGSISPEMIASTVSWAMFGAVKEWTRTPDRRPTEEIVATIVQLVSPLMHPQIQTLTIPEGTLQP
jgi:AcrR family transcriptional regulator